jgi:flagellar basal body-associated protein FliL
MADKKKKKGDDDAGDDDESGGGGKKKKIIIGVVVAAAGYFAYTNVLASPPPPVDAEGAAVAGDVQEEPVEGEILELPEVVVNLADDSPRYLRVSVALVLEEGLVADEFELESAIAKDVVLEYLSAQTFDRLKDPLAKRAVKDELSSLVRGAYDDDKVVRVLFTSFVMQ